MHRNMQIRMPELFRSREQEWKNQLVFIQDLAAANDVKFDPSCFRKPRRYIKGLRILWRQSDAALYIAKKLHERRKNGLPIFQPWSAAWLVIDEWKVENQPFFFVTILDDGVEPLNDGKVRAYVFSTKRNQSSWVSMEAKIMVYAMCKHCLHQWTHHPLMSTATMNDTNPGDIITVVGKNGKEYVSLKCPNCGSMEIYKAGHHIH